MVINHLLTGMILQAGLRDIDVMQKLSEKVKFLALDRKIYGVFLHVGTQSRDSS